MLPPLSGRPGRDVPALSGTGDGDNRRPEAHLMGGVSAHSFLSRGSTVSQVPVAIQGNEEGPELVCLPVLCCMRLSLQPRGWAGEKELF